jgi:hypothetical protein
VWYKFTDVSEVLAVSIITANIVRLQDAATQKTPIFVIKFSLKMYRECTFVDFRRECKMFGPQKKK